jgi:hypothetical protein
MEITSSFASFSVDISLLNLCSLFIFIATQHAVHLTICRCKYLFNSISVSVDKSLKHYPTASYVLFGEQSLVRIQQAHLLKNMTFSCVLDDHCDVEFVATQGFTLLVITICSDIQIISVSNKI